MFAKTPLHFLNNTGEQNRYFQMSTLCHQTSIHSGDLWHVSILRANSLQVVFVFFMSFNSAAFHCHHCLNVTMHCGFFPPKTMMRSCQKMHIFLKKSTRVHKHLQLALNLMTMYKVMMADRLVSAPTNPNSTHVKWHLISDFLSNWITAKLYIKQSFDLNSHLLYNNHMQKPPEVCISDFFSPSDQSLRINFVNPLGILL